MSETTPTTARRTRRARFLVGAAVAGVVALPVAAGAAAGFGDVSDDNVHVPGITWVAENDITAGCGDGTNYCPNDSVTRAQMATFMQRLAGHAAGVAASVDAATVGGFTAAELMAGDGGISGASVESSQVTLATGDAFETLTTSCGAGEIALAGGYTLLNGPNEGASLGASEWFVVSDGPNQAGTGWTVSVRHEAAGPAADRALRVHATCATP